MTRVAGMSAPLAFGLAVLLAASCDQLADLNAPAIESGPVAFAVDPADLEISAGRVRVCKDGPAGTYDFTINANTGNVDLPHGTSFTLNAGECKDVALATANSQTVTVTESTPTLPIAFDHVDIYLLIGSSTPQGTASLVGSSQDSEVMTGTFGGDRAYVLVYTNISTANCTLTLGFWKTHAGFNGNNGDLVTPLLPQWLGTPAGASSIQVTTAAQAVTILQFNGAASNGINKLYAQLLTAKLNGAAGADLSAVAATIAAADAFLANNNAGSWASLSKAQQQTVLNWITQLDDFNNGVTGPGHCGG